MQVVPNDMIDAFTQVGGIRCGSSYWNATNSSWPFVKLCLSQDMIEITIRGLVSSPTVLQFARSDIRGIRERKGLFSAGIQIEHKRCEYAPFVIFWTFDYSGLRNALKQRGFPLIEESYTERLN